MLSIQVSAAWHYHSSAKNPYLSTFMKFTKYVYVGHRLYLVIFITQNFYVELNWVVCIAKTLLSVLSNGLLAVCSSDSQHSLVL